MYSADPAAAPGPRRLQPLPTYYVQRTLVLGCSACSCVRYAGLRCTRVPGRPDGRGRRGDGSGLSDSAALEEEETPPYIICIRCPDNTSRRGDQRRRKTLAGPRRSQDHVHAISGPARAAERNLPAAARSARAPAPHQRSVPPSAEHAHPCGECLFTRELPRQEKAKYAPPTSAASTAPKTPRVHKRSKLGTSDLRAAPLCSSSRILRTVAYGRSSEAIRGHQRSSEFLRREWSSTAPCRQQS